MEEKHYFSGSNNGGLLNERTDDRGGEAWNNYVKAQSIVIMIRKSDDIDIRELADVYLLLRT
jgi:hypothetical protein